MNMPASLGSVDVDVSANLDRLLNGFRDAERAADRFDRELDKRVTQSAQRAQKATESLAAAETRLGRSFGTTQQAADRFGRSVEKAGDQSAKAARATDGAVASLRRTLLSTAGLITAALGANQVKEITDSYTRFTNQLKVAGIEGARLTEVQGDLFEIGQKYGVQLEALGSLHGRLTQSQKELNASSAQMMIFTNGVAAAVKVQGATTEQSKGALLQLTQALGGAVVRAEEFNSINEGARPILQAVANGIERFGGSVAKLRAEVIDGKVTSQEFFQGFLQGSADLEAQAAKANLTIGASLVTLNNALGKYIGETDAAYSATARIGMAISALAENLDTVIPALGVIAGLIATRYVVAIGASAAAHIGDAIAKARDLAVTEALALAQLQLNGALMGGVVSANASTAAITRLSVAKGLLTRASGGVVAMLGGPYGAALAATAAAVYLVYQHTVSAHEANGKYAAGLQDSNSVTDKAAELERKLAIAKGQAREATLKEIAAERDLIGKKIESARWSVLLARAELQRARVRAESVEQGPSSPMAAGAGAGGGMEGAVFGATVATQGELRQAEANEKAADQALTELERGLNKIDGMLNQGAGSGGGGAASGTGKGKKGPKGPSLADTANRFDQERASIQQQAVAAEASSAKSAEEKAELDLRALEMTRKRMLVDIARDEHYSDAQKKVLTEQVEALAEVERENVERDKRKRLAQESREIGQAILDKQVAELEGQRDIAKTATERRAIDREILRLRREFELQQALAIANSQDSTNAEKSVALLDSERIRAGGAIDERGARRGVEDELGETAPEWGEFADKEKIEDIRDAEAEKLAVIKEALEMRLITEEEAAARRVEIEQDAANKIAEVEAARNSERLQSAQSIAGSLMSVLENTVGKHNAAYKAMFVAEKAFAIADSIIQIQVALAKALALPFPANLPAMAQVAAIGASIVSNVMAVSAQFDKGGWTGDMARDAAAGVVHGQEFVVKAGPAARHRPMLESLNAGRDPTAALGAAAAGGGLMGNGRGRVMVKQMPGVAIEYRESMTSGDVEIIAERAVERHAPKVIAADLDRPNSRTRKSLRRNTSAKEVKR